VTKAVRSWFRLDFRRRWRSLAVLGVLVALAAGTVMTAVAGANRGATAIDRLAAQTLPADAMILPNEPGFDWAAVRAMPPVEALSTFVVSGYEIEGLDLMESLLTVGFPPADDEAMRTVERPVVIDGRLPDPSRGDEVVVTPLFADSHGLGPGDTLTLKLWRPETFDRHWTDPLPPRADGPVVQARIVGVVRSFWYGEEVGHPGKVISSPGLYDQYAANLVGSVPTGYINALARLDGGEAAVSQFTRDLAAVTGRTNIDVWSAAELRQRARDVTGFEANALRVFALAAGIAAVFLVGQAIARYSAATVMDLQTLRSVGLTPAEARVAAAAGPALAAVAGTAVGVIAAVLASRWFPIGTAGLYEPEPGIHADGVLIVTSLVVVPLAVTVGAVVAAGLALRSAGPATGAGRSVIANAAGRSGLPVPVVIGTRFALEPGRGRHAVPVRPALVGAVTGVLGVVAAFTFSSGVNDAAANPARFGQTYPLQAIFGYENADFLPAADLLPVIAADPDVAAVAKIYGGVAEHQGVATTVFSFEPVGNAPEVVVTGGRLPERADEIALAPKSARAMGAGVGDSVTLTGTRGTAGFTVTGLAFVPGMSHNDYATGAWTTPNGYDELFTAGEVTDFKYHAALVALHDGADPQATATRIAEQTAPAVQAAAAGFGLDPAEIATLSGVELTPPWPPIQIAELQQVRTLPVFLAGFLAVLAVGAVGHALATAVRRRRHDVAVLRALGLTRWQCRGVVVTQASVLALVGLAAGIPLGVALGRTLWRYVSDATPLFYVAPVALLTLLLVVPLALLIANLLAAWPGQRAATLRVGQVLRAE
jgi:hypothetical protein